MKRIIATLLAALPLIMMDAETETADTTFIYGDKHILVCDSAGKTRVSVCTADSGQMKRTYETEFVGGQEIQRMYVSTVFFPEIVMKKPSLYSHYPSLFFGFSMLGNGVMSPGGNNEMHSRDSKSWEWGITLAKIAFRTTEQTSINFALTFGQVHHHFQGNYVLATTDGKSYMKVVEDGEVKKSYISYNSIKVPVTFEWAKRIHGKTVYAGLGASLEFRYKDHSRYFIGKKKYTSTGDTNINPIGINLEAYMGIWGITVYGRAGLTPLLKRSNAPECHTFTVGIGF